MTRHSERDHAARGKFDDEKDKESAKSEIDDRQKITGPNVVRMVMQEHSPRLIGFSRWLDPPQVTLDGALGNLDAQLEKFPTDAFRSPQWILLGPLLNQRDGLSGNLGGIGF